MTSWTIWANPARALLPEFQRVQVGDRVYLTALTWDVVVDFRENEYMLWRGDGKVGNTGTWAWGLYPQADGSTRLVTRMRGAWSWWPPSVLIMLSLMEIFELAMMRKSMLGIRDRSEALARGEIKALSGVAV